MKRGLAAGEIHDHESGVIEKLEQAHAIVQREIGRVQSMHVTHRALTIACTRDGEDRGPLMPPQIETNPRERKQGQRDFT